VCGVVFRVLWDLVGVRCELSWAVGFAWCAVRYFVCCGICLVCGGDISWPVGYAWCAVRYFVYCGICLVCGEMFRVLRDMLGVSPHFGSYIIADHTRFVNNSIQDKFYSHKQYSVRTRFGSSS
jgi:hypothetical protein